MLSPVAWAPAPLPSPECCTLTTSAFTAIDQSARVAVGRQEQSSSRRLAVSQPGWDLRPGHSATAVKTTTAAYAHPWRVHRVPDVLEGHVGRPEGQPCTGLHRLRTSAGQRCPRRGRGLQPGHWRSTCSVITESMLDTAWYQTSTSGLSMLQTPPPPGSCVSTCTHGGLQPGGQCGHQTRRHAPPKTNMACTQSGIRLARSCTCQGSTSSTGALRCMRSMLCEANT